MMIFWKEFEDKVCDLLLKSKINGDCIECHLAPIPEGYCQVSLGRGMSIGVHRLIWEVHNGDIPKGLLILHSCDNRKCMNIKHLFLGTHKENTADMFSKGRNKNGIRTDRQNEKKIQQFRELRDAGFSYDAIANKLKVSRTTVRNYVAGVYSKPIS